MKARYLVLIGLLASTGLVACGGDSGGGCEGLLAAPGSGTGSYHAPPPVRVSPPRVYTPAPRISPTPAPRTYVAPRTTPSPIYVPPVLVIPSNGGC